MAAAAILILSGCGSGSRGHGGSTTSRAPLDGEDLALPGLSVSGGSASASGTGSGGDGGSFTVRSQGAIQVTPDPPPAAPSLPSVPSASNIVGDLSGDRVYAGSASVVGTVISSGSSPIR